MDTDPTEMIALVDAPREVKRQGIDDPPTYRTFYVAVLDGKLRCGPRRQVRGRTAQRPLGSETRESAGVRCKALARRVGMTGIVIQEWAPVEKNTLRGFVRARMPSGVIFHDCASTEKIARGGSVRHRSQ
jgi:hypothetical protein